MPVETPPYGFDSGLVPLRADMLPIRLDLLIDKRVSIVSVGLFCRVMSGAIDASEAYKWWKNASSNQIKTAVKELILGGYVTEVGETLAFHYKNL